MSHNGNTGCQYSLHRVDNFRPAFQFQSVAAAFLHNTDGIGHSFRGIDLIRTERHVAYDQCPFHTVHHRSRMVYHLIQRNRKRGRIARHHVRRRIANQNHIHSGTVYNTSHRIVV